MRTTTRRTLTPLALALLELLRGRPMHPYEMQQIVRDRGIDHVIKVRAGSLYHTIERLHRLKLIEPVETGREGRRPERTVYAITDLGQDEYLRNLCDLIRDPEDEYPVFGAAVEMLRTLDRATAVSLLEQRTTMLEALIAAHDQAGASLAKRGIPRIGLIELEYLTAMQEAELRWVRRLIDEIRSGELEWTGTPTDNKENTP